MLIKKYRILYVWLFLCGDATKFKTVQEEALKQEINEGFREKYIDALEKLR